MTFRHAAALAETLPHRLVLGVDQFFKAMRYTGELRRLAYRTAYREAVSQGALGAEAVRVADSATASRSNDPTLRADAFSTVLRITWSGWSRAESEPSKDEKRAARVGKDKLLNMSRWRSVAEIPNFPFSSFAEMLGAIKAGHCYMSVPSTAFLFTNVTSSRAAQALSAFLSWVPVLIAFGSIALAVGLKNGWMLFGVPVAALGLVIGAAPLSLLQPILYSAANDPSVWLFLRLISKMALLLLSPIVGTFLAPMLFAWMLFTDRQAVAWVIASYMLSVHAIRVYRARGVNALLTAVQQSEAFFLFALSDGSCGLRYKTGEFLTAIYPPKEVDL